MADPHISVCIPAFEMNGRGGEFLAHSFTQLEAQDFKDFEVVVSDQSRDNGVAEVCERFSSSLDIRRIDNTAGKRQSSANMNNAIRNARGRILRYLFQDDFLYGQRSLSLIDETFRDPAVSWAVTACAHSSDGTTITRPLVPRYHDRIHFGVNTISSPSVVAIRNDNPPLFDEAMIWLMDVEYYKRCAERFGPPAVIEEVSVINRIHPGQVTHTVTGAIKRHELRHVLKKHWHSTGPGDVLHFLKRYYKARR